MLLYDPDRKSEFSTRSTDTNLSTLPRYVLYYPDDHDQHAPSKAKSMSAPSAAYRHHGHSIEFREPHGIRDQYAESMAVAVAPTASPYYYDKHVLDDPYDAHGIRQGAWESGLWNLRACVPMTLGVPFALPSIAVAQVNVRLGLSRYYGAALLKEFVRLVAILGSPFIGIAAYRKLRSMPGSVVGASPEDSMETTPWMVLLSVAFLTAWVLLFTTALALSALRFKIRKRFQIPGSPGRDMCVIVCLPSCAIAQMSTHVRCLRSGRYSLARPETLPPYEY